VVQSLSGNFPYCVCDAVRLGWSALVQILSQKCRIGEEEGVRNERFEVWARMSERLVGSAWFVE